MYTAGDIIMSRCSTNTTVKKQMTLTRFSPLQRVHKTFKETVVKKKMEYFRIKQGLFGVFSCGQA